MKVYLIVAKGRQKGTPIPIKVDLFLMGSDPVCQLRSKLPGVAPQHCALISRDKKVFVRDLEGGETLINNDVMPPGEEWPVHAGDRLALGPLEFMIQFHERALSQKDAEEWALKSLDKDAARSGKELDDEDPESGLIKATRPPENAAMAAGALLEKLSAQKGVIKGRLRVTEAPGGVRILRFNDTYLVEEAEIAFIKKELMMHLEGPPRRYLLDFKNVARMSSAASEMLKEVRRRIEGRGGSVALCRVRSDLQLILETVGILPEIHHFRSKDEAMTASW